MATTHYETLEVAPTATQEQIRAAYRRLAKLHHPDTGAQAGHQRMVHLNEAYEVLSQPDRRRSYDRELAGRGGVAHQTVPPRSATVRVASEEEEVLRWLKEVYQPVNGALNRILKPFRRQLDELSYDPYDDALMADFQAYLERSRRLYTEARRTFVSRPNPSGVARVAEFLFHCLNHLGDALDELHYFTLNYDDRQLHVGHELLRRVAELRRQATEAASRIPGTR
jgi:molecular chaperone DnaJ